MLFYVELSIKLFNFFIRKYNYQNSLNSLSYELSKYKQKSIRNIIKNIW